MTGLTERSYRILEAIHDLTLARGRTPDLADVRWASRTLQLRTVSLHLNRLGELGLLCELFPSHYMLALTPRGRAVLDAWRGALLVQDEEESAFTPVQAEFPLQGGAA